MHFDVEKRKILFVRHGSHAYGLNIPTSDEDFKGVCIKPKECYYGFLNKFEQQEHMGSKTDGVDSVIYSIDKFCSLAAECNPNILEILFVDDSDVLFEDKFGELLRSKKEEFVSKKAKFTYASYAYSQLKRIKTHRSWLLNPPKAKPEREDYLGNYSPKVISPSELGAFLAATDEARESLPKEMITIFTKEKEYQDAVSRYSQYVNWKRDRNPVRAELEANFGYDVKHGMHLIRLMRMCKEILSTGKVNVKRVDRDELLAIRRGIWSYDQLVDQAENLQKECDELYETSTLPNNSNRVLINNLLIDITDKYLKLNG